MAVENSKKHRFDWKFSQFRNFTNSEYSGFRGRWFCYETFKIQNGGSKFEGSILLKICIKGFLITMIKILLLDYKNSKW